MLPAFSTRRIRDLYSVFGSKALEYMSILEKQIGTKARKATINISSWNSRVTLDIIGKAGFDFDFNSLTEPHSKLNTAYEKAFEASKAAQRLRLLTLIIPGWLLDILPIERQQIIHRSMDIVKETFRNVVSEKIQASQEGVGQNVDILNVAYRNGLTSPDDLLDQTLTFLGAGQETSAWLLSFAIYSLSLPANRYMQDRLRAEIRSAISSPSMSNLSKVDPTNLPYLSAVRSETLRLWAIVPVLQREVAVSPSTTIIGQTLPIGAGIRISRWAMHRCSALWGEDALEFKPERWLESEGNEGWETGGAKGKEKMAYMPFNYGPRSCIGQGFAKSEFAFIMAALIGRFEFTFRGKEGKDEGDIEVLHGTTTQILGGLWVDVSLLEGW